MSLFVTVPTARLAENIGALPEGVELEIWDMASPAPRERIDLVVPPYMGGAKFFGALEGLEVGLVQSQSIGYDGVEEQLPAGIPFANAASVHEASTAELAVALTLAAQRQLPRFVLAQQDGQWSPVFAESLADRKVLLVGFGGVGEAIALRLEPFEIDLTVVARTARPVWHERLGRVQVHAIDELPALLPDAEIVILALPGGGATHHLFDDEMLGLMSDSALLVNVGRGTLVDTDALVRQQGRIRAALDVLDPEPLPAEHPLWKTDGVLIAPHVGGASTAMNPRIARLIRKQVERMLRGEAPANVVLGG
ncbi:2-hydroxyacid dehydrogenase [Microbacterium aerolatum]|uniref:Dehydrogenase n=1 Tax=Microbacterium aerolatum TaxID=153731 RepID=A0A511AIL0_9MICO|nr:2-hydroxyacid dehydrogenase [Microbacterium aerolatum]GEK87886.1 dehydrogenase [Microbacterium aerolatum]GGB32493.1 dehydrogenase [Microbacterium aerolatum]